MAKYIISACKNPITSEVDVLVSGYIKSLEARTYIVDDDYDFGAIDPVDIVKTLYRDRIRSVPGIKMKE